MDLQRDATAMGQKPVKVNTRNIRRRAYKSYRFLFFFDYVKFESSPSEGNHIEDVTGSKVVTRYEN